MAAHITRIRFERKETIETHDSGLSSLSQEFYVEKARSTHGFVQMAMTQQLSLRTAASGFPKMVQF
jgi:hypothetical protein